MVIVGAIAARVFHQFQTKYHKLQAPPLLWCSIQLSHLQTSPLIKILIGKDNFQCIKCNVKPTSEHIRQILRKIIPHTKADLDKINAFHFLPTSSTFFLKLTSATVNMEVSHTLESNLGNKKSPRHEVIWSTCIINSQTLTEYWLTEASLDVSTFLMLYFTEKKVKVEHMLSYKLNNDFFPMCEGSAESDSFLVHFQRYA